ncbi:MAG: hypothetical protein HYV07_00250 [Deltaproteobacteria bacterium]|nr:hypothetical protein [Deltaproteobacteria bacterium]
MRRFWILISLLSACVSDPTPSGEPPYERIDRGEPVSKAELEEATDLYLELVDRIRFFEITSKLAHGYPDRPERLGYSTWWSGVRVRREGPKLTFLHSNDGADNNGLRTGPILESICFSQKLRPDPAREEFLRRMVRGFESWILAMERTSAPDAPVLMTRASYPAPVSYQDNGLEITIDYSLNRPGLDNGATEYVHLADNPYWGDLYVKNKRSKDDIGHMLLALASLDVCRDALSADAVEEIDRVIERYEAWSRQVEDDGFRISTYDKELEVWIPVESLAIFVQTLDAECDAMLTLRLVGRGASSGKSCGNGINDSDLLFSELNDNNRHIFWSFHQASAWWSRKRGELEASRQLVTGLAARMDDLFAKLAADEAPTFFDAPDFAAFITHAAILGVPLTSREVRYVHQQIKEAHDGYFSEASLKAIGIFDPGAGDGETGFGPGGPGLDFRTIGLALGTCVSPIANPAGRPLLDCARL